MTKFSVQSFVVALSLSIVSAISFCTDFFQLIKIAGYPVEVHSVTTEDGYVLEVHRLPSRDALKPPVILQHGILCSSSIWVMQGPGQSLAYLLYDLGYDVWLGNFRGNRYSRSHAKISPDANPKDFWNFSFHEMGLYDLPALIDHVLRDTGKPDVLYVGHSMGTTAFFVMMSERPSYNAKVRAMSAMAPVARMQQVRSPIIRVAASLHPPFATAANLTGIREFLPKQLPFRLVGRLFLLSAAIWQIILYVLMFAVIGFDSSHLQTNLLPVLPGYLPDCTSVKTLVHYGQNIRDKHFRLYDFGVFKNFFKYGSLRPPSYKLQNIEVPVSIHHTESDWLLGPKDIGFLQSNLKNVISVFRINNPKFSHVDFLLSRDAKALVYGKVIEFLRSHSTF